MTNMSADGADQRKTGSTYTYVISSNTAYMYMYYPYVWSGYVPGVRV